MSRREQLVTSSLVSSRRARRSSRRSVTSRVYKRKRSAAGHTDTYRGTDLSEEAVGRTSSPVRGLAVRVAGTGDVDSNIFGSRALIASICCLHSFVFFWFDFALIKPFVIAH